MGCPCGKLSSDVPSRVSQHKGPRASESVWASLLQDRSSGDSSRDSISGGKEGGRVNQTTSLSECKTRRDLMEADVHQQLTGVSSEGLGLIKLFLTKLKVILNQVLYQTEVVVMYVDWVSRVTWFYNVLWPSSLYFSICH